jgi:hypothetical protein
MLSHCANLQCSRPFLRLGQGRLFLVETECVAKLGELTAPPSPYSRRQPRRVERYWLCEQCAQLWTLVHDQRQGIVLLPLRQTAVSARPALGEEQSETA